MRLIHNLYIKLIKNFTINKIKYLFVLFLLSPFLIFILLIRPVVLIRFGDLDCTRIGNVFNAEQYLLFCKFKKKVKSFDIWVTGDFISNEQYLIILKRKFLVIQHLFIFYKVLEILSKYINIYSKHIINIHVAHDFHDQNLLNKYPIQLNLTKQEINKGELILKQMGIPKNAKIVCITSRDSLYLRRTHPSVDFSYHNYRDSNVNNYIPAIKALIKKNFYVVKMGKIAAKRVNIKSNKFIDYSFHPLRSDLMDFFLAYKCYFWIGNNTGLDQVARVFRKPLVLTNMAPFIALKMHAKKNYYFLKTHVNSKNQKLSISKIFDYGLASSLYSENFKKKKIQLIELNPKEYKDVILESLKLMKDSWRIKNKKDFELQRKFRKLYLKKTKEFNFKDLYGKIKSIYSPYFLRKNQWFLK